MKYSCLRLSRCFPDALDTEHPDRAAGVLARLVMRPRGLPIWLAAFACSLPAGAAFSQGIELGPGGVQQSVRDSVTVPEHAQPGAKAARIQSTPPVSRRAADGGRGLEVKGFEFTGNTVFDDKALQAAVESSVGGALTLGELDDLASRLTAMYRSAGYSMAQVVVPVQEIQGGIVKFEVLEGRLASVVVQRGKGVRLSASRIDAVLAGLPVGKPVHMPTLERVLLQLTDYPGLDIRSTLRPGSRQGTVELVVAVEQGGTVQSRVTFDNFGNRYTGTTRVGLAMQLDDLWGIGDRLSLGAMRSDGDLRNYSLQWETPVGSSGLKFHAGYSQVDYRLGGDFDVLDVTGRASHAEIGLRYPWLRTRDASSWAYLTLAQDRFKERVGLLDTENPKRTNSARIGMSGQWRDAFGGGAVTAWDASATFGRLDLMTDEAKAWDSASANSSGGYALFNASLNRLQRISGPWSLAAGVKGQLASGNLDSSSKFYLGGPNGVRAYESGEAGGDVGIMGSLELRRQIRGGLYAFGFFDLGHIRVNKNPWDDSKNSYDLRAYGLGAHWDLGRYGYVRAVYALRAGGSPELSELNGRSRIWLSASLAPEALPAMMAAAFPGTRSSLPAESSKVVVYGILNTDVEFASRSGATPEADGRGATPSAAPTGVNVSNTPRMQSNSSAVGLRGTESLGGGSYAWYQIESSVNSATGDGTVAGRNTGVGVRSRHWGNVMFGKWDTPYKAATSGYDPFLGTQVTAYYNILGNPGFGVSTGNTISPIKTATDRASSSGDASFSRRQDNSVQYWTPRWNGFTARAMIATGGEQISGYAGKPLIWATSLNWQKGPLTLTAAYEQHDNFFGVATLFSRAATGRGIGSRIGPITDTSSRDYGVKLGARYDFGHTRLSLIWERLVYSQDGVVPADSPTLMRYERDALWLGVQHTVGRLTLQGSAGVADQGKCRVASTDPAQQDCSTDGLGAYMLSLGVKYSLSTRTDVYAQYARIFNGRSASYNFSPGGVFGAGVGSDPQAFGIGIIHQF